MKQRIGTSRVIGLWVGLGLLFASLNACGTSTSSGSGSSSGTTSSSGGETSSGGTSSSGSSSGGSSGDGFRVTGTVHAPTVSSLNRTGKSASDGVTTHVMAVSPVAGSADCRQAELESDGSFDIELPTGQPWLLYFIDQAQQGTSMLMGRFVSGELETLAPDSAATALDLGTVTLDTTAKTAAASTSAADIVSGLGITDAIASLLGTVDDIAARYQNPDVDGDGAVDCTASSAQPYMLDFHVRYNMRVGARNATVADLINTTLDTTNTTTEYTGTGIYVAYPTSFASVDTGSVTFADSAVTTSEGGAIAAGTATTAVTTNNFSGYYGFGPNTTSASELPQGDIAFTVADHTLTFAGIVTPTLAELTAPTGRIFPFLQFNTDDSACTSACTFASLGYQWMKKTADGWTAATMEELEILIAPDTPYLSLIVGNDRDQRIGFAIPTSAVSGTIAWEAANATFTETTAADLDTITSDSLCFGLSYDDLLGMRYFEGIDGSAGSCGL